MKLKPIAANLVPGFLLTSFALLTGIDGKWAGEIKTPDGNKSPIHFTFKTDKEKLTGTSQGTHNSYDLSDGKVNGDSLTFSFEVDNGAKISGAGKYYPAGDSISLNLIFMGNEMHSTLNQLILVWEFR
jgi:hypothetical protein